MSSSPANDGGSAPPRRRGMGSLREVAAAAPRRPAGPFGWFLGMSLLGRCLVIVGAVFALFCLYFGEENWRGRRAWENCRRDLETRGVQLDWQKFVPPAVPDDQNFAMT